MRIKVGWLLLATLPGISFAGQGIFLNVNNFTKDDVYLEVESEKDWKVGDLGGGIQYQPARVKDYILK